MTRNVGMLDQYARIIIGFALVAFALQGGLDIRGWHWAGLFGIVLLATAFFRICPAYAALGISTCKTQIGKA